uniref:Neurotransmitter-gated ion-channel ligand-binding domain-containing protein n=1 Tax=Acrobeloides nanus TaxID=290746 RepID=A0A914E017_9BILA
MSFYQIILVNEPEQNIKLNVWMIQRWTDELLGWNPHKYGLINTTTFPHDSVWVPDTYVYNSVVMNHEETERYMNVRADSLYWEGKRGSNMSFLYPAIYTINCKIVPLFWAHGRVIALL